MDLVNYVKKFGHLDFQQRPFNDVDAAILSVAVYSNLEVVAPSIHDTKSYMTLFKDISTFDMSIVTAGKTFMKRNATLIPLMAKYKRFCDIGIKYVYKVFNEDLDNQFYACTFIIPDIGAYIALRGTDSTNVGWKEDFNLSIKNVVISQLDAVDYIDVVSKMVAGPLMVGGHSKGGNLTLFAAVRLPDKIKERITNFYIFDGNGLNKDDFYEQERYKSIVPKIRYLCPKNTVIGAIMNTPKDKIVVPSTSVYILEHNPHSWVVNPETGDFIHLPSISKSAKERTIFFKEFINDVGQDEKELAISFFIEYLGGAKNTVFNFFMSFGKIIRFTRLWKKLTPVEKEKMNSVAKSFKKCKKIAKAKCKQ